MAGVETLHGQGQLIRLRRSHTAVSARPSSRGPASSACYACFRHRHRCRDFWRFTKPSFSQARVPRERVSRALLADKNTACILIRLPPLDHKREPDRYVFFAVAGGAFSPAGALDPRAPCAARGRAAGRGCCSLQARRHLPRADVEGLPRGDQARCGGASCLRAQARRPHRNHGRCDHRVSSGGSRSHLHRRHPVRHLSDQLAGGSSVCHAPGGRTHFRGGGSGAPRSSARGGSERKCAARRQDHHLRRARAVSV